MWCEMVALDTEKGPGEPRTGTRALPRYRLQQGHPPGIGQRLGNLAELLRGQGSLDGDTCFHSLIVIELLFSCQGAGRLKRWRGRVSLAAG